MTKLRFFGEYDGRDCHCYACGADTSARAYHLYDGDVELQMETWLWVCSCGRRFYLSHARQRGYSEVYSLREWAKGV